MPISLKEKLKQAATKGGLSSPTRTHRNEPLWKGPEDPSDMGGITYSMLSRFLNCRERFRITVIEGLRPTETFDAKIEFGQMWHTCEEALAKRQPWEPALKVYGQGLVKKFPMQLEEVDKWYNVVKTQFPFYVKYWAKHPDVKDRTPLFQEQVFHVPYKLPSGRTVYLRGKWDSVDLIGKGKTAAIYLQENKTKGKIIEQQLVRQLTFDLQTMIYIISLSYNGEIRDKMCEKAGGDYPISGVRYNVIRRDCPIRRHKATGKKDEETKEHFYKRLADDYFEIAPQEWFMRWKVEVQDVDVQRFRRECLDPILEQCCWWYEEVTGNHEHSRGIKGEMRPWYPPQLHYRHPFGVYNVLNEGGSSDLDEYLATGSTVGLQQVDRLFKELG